MVRSPSAKLLQSSASIRNFFTSTKQPMNNNGLQISKKINNSPIISPNNSPGKISSPTNSPGKINISSNNSPISQGNKTSLSDEYNSTRGGLSRKSNAIKFRGSTKIQLDDENLLMKSIKNDDHNVLREKIKYYQEKFNLLKYINYYSIRCYKYIKNKILRSDLVVWTMLKSRILSHDIYIAFIKCYDKDFTAKAVAHSTASLG